MARVLIAGCGDVGGALGGELAGAGHEVWGLRRRVSELPGGIRPLAADLAAPEALPELPAGLDFVFFTAAAGRRDEATYRAVYLGGLGRVLEALEREGQRPRRVFFTSSTGVYGRRDGAWVDEETPPEPAAFTGRVMLEAEALLAASPLPGVSVRLGGIYGPGRQRLLRRAREGEPVRKEPPLYTNRIHRDDCAALLGHLMQLPEPADLYLGVDREPASQWEVICWLRRAMGLPEPPALPAGEGPGRPSKRCSSRRLLATGYELRYPTFREGYGELLGL